MACSLRNELDQRAYTEVALCASDDEDGYNFE